MCLCQDTHFVFSRSTRKEIPEIYPAQIFQESDSHTRTRRAKEAVDNDTRSLFFYQFCGSTRHVQMCTLPKETGHTVISSGNPVSTPSIIMFNYKNVTPSAASKTGQNGKNCISVVLPCLQKFTGASLRSAARAKRGKKGLKPNMEDMQVCCHFQKSSFAHLLCNKIGLLSAALSQDAQA